jgi:hypothetical protein
MVSIHVAATMKPTKANIVEITAGGGLWEEEGGGVREEKGRRYE